jgi:microsomal dipeptidase-like Zn-dependent dipeptidase
MTPRPRARIALVGGLAVLVSSILFSPASVTGETLRAQFPEDRYAMAGGCYALKADPGYVTRAAEGFAATAGDLGDAEPFTFQATDLGSYLLYGAAEDFMAANEGLLGETVYGVTDSIPGQIVGGVALEQTDAAADEVARSDVNEATGRGASVVAAAAPSELADWVIDDAGDGLYSIALPATDQVLAAGAEGALVLAPGNAGSGFTLELTSGCAAYPEIQVNVDGPIAGGDTSFEEVRGYLDAHLHMMAFEFLGGRARCGRPWHRYGVAYAMVDCPDHFPNGEAAVLEMVLSGEFGQHSTDGWPTFEGWPRSEYLAHEQVYYKWLERAWRGGLRMFVNLLVDNNQLCKIYPFKRNSCNEMDGVRLQAQRIRELERYIDAQSGGPGEGWFRIVTDPFAAREVMNEGKLAVVLGIEVSVPLDCGLTLELPRCDLAQIESGLDEVYDLGVRQMELVNKFDNAFSGVTGDGGTTGIVVNQGNLGDTGRYWRMETCTEADGHAHDKQQMNFHDDAGTPDELTGRDALVGQILAATGTSGVAPLYPEGPHCNVLGLSDLGEQMIRGLAERGMIFDPDHMSARARTQAMDLIEELEYSGVMSSHSWADDTIYPRVYELGGVVTPHAGSSSSFVGKWQKHKAWADPRYYWGIGFGSDINGFSRQGGPRGADVPNPVTYPFTGFGGVTVQQNVAGTRTYNFNADGVAHYGMYPDWIEDLRILAGEQAIEDMARGPEAYLQMWERAIGIAPDACRPDVPDLTDAQVDGLDVGMTPRAVLDGIGQPNRRAGAEFSYCMTGDRTATVAFSEAGSLLDIVVS